MIKKTEQNKIPMNLCIERFQKSYRRDFDILPLTNLEIMVVPKPLHGLRVLIRAKEKKIVQINRLRS